MRATKAEGTGIARTMPGRFASDQAIRVQLTDFDNGFAERLIGSIRRECVDRVIVLGKAHLRQILRRTGTTRR